MKDLIKSWKRRSEKYKKLANNSINEIVIEGLLASSEVYIVCADELERNVASQQAVAPDAESEWFCIECKHNGNIGEKCDHCLMPRR